MPQKPDRFAAAPKTFAHGHRTILTSGIAAGRPSASITSDSPRCELFATLLRENLHVRYFESGERGYVCVDLTRDRMETRLQIICDRRDPKATGSTLKRFVVEVGRPGAIPA